MTQAQPAHPAGARTPHARVHASHFARAGTSTPHAAYARSQESLLDDEPSEQPARSAEDLATEMSRHRVRRKP
jgi:hypothetical protein